VFFKFSKTHRAKAVQLGRPALSVNTIDPTLPTARSFFQISGHDEAEGDVHEARYFRLTLTREDAIRVHAWLTSEL